MNILLIGASGNIAGALWSAWKDNSTYSSITAVSPRKTDRMAKLLSDRDHYYDSPELIENKNFDAIVFAVKPQKIAEILPLYSEFVTAETTILSVVAGKSTDFIREGLNASKDVPIIRAMPNTPCQLNEGVIGCYTDQSVDEMHCERAEKLFKSTGLVFWVKREEQMHAVTAVSGSGPGFVDAFMEECEQQGLSHLQAIHEILDAANGRQKGHAADFLRAYQQAALAQDFADENLIKAITCKTFKGTATLALKEDTKSFQELREAVTSPNGTTAAGLKVWNDMRGNDLTARTYGTIDAARLRSIELA